MNIIVVRHGQTDWNVRDLLQGRTDIELNETGKSQAIETANNLKNINIDVIFVSPLKRTRRTAEEINRIRNLDVTIDERLIERGFGDYEGQAGVDFKKYWDLQANISDNNVEPIKELFERIYSLLNELWELYGNTDKTILLVTHNGTNLAITSILNGLVPNIFEYNLKPCEYRIFENIKREKGEKFCGKYKI